MTREETREAVKVMVAYANGKEIQYLDDNNKWIDTPNPVFDWSRWAYRVKPKQEYRPFKTQEECWNEMLKHQPFGWIVRSSDDEYLHIGRIHDRGSYNGYGITLSCNESIRANFDAMFKGFKFVDGTPFGIKEE